MVCAPEIGLSLEEISTKDEQKWEKIVIIRPGNHSARRSHLNTRREQLTSSHPQLAQLPGRTLRFFLGGGSTPAARRFALPWLEDADLRAGRALPLRLPLGLPVSLWLSFSLSLSLLKLGLRMRTILKRCSRRVWCLVFESE